MMSDLYAAVERALIELGAAPAVLAVDDSTGLAAQDDTIIWSGSHLLALVDLLAARLAPSTSAAAAAAGGPVALFLSNSVAFVAGALACLRLGAPFMPLDPRWPAARLRQVAAIARPAAAVWAAGGHVAGGHGCPELGLPGIQMVELRAGTLRQARLQAGAPPPPAPSPPPETAPAAAPSTAYVLFTSGSTGRPLGVCGTGEGVLNRCAWMQRAHPLAPTDLVAFSTAPCFVDSVWQVFAALLAGAPLLAVPLACAASPRRLLTFLAQQGASHVVAVPSMWGPMLRCIEEGAVAAASLSALRLVASSGEPLPPALLRRLRAALPGRTVLNVYGCTEAAADAACLECSALEAGEGARSIVPVGAPISNTVLAIAAAAAAAADDDEDDGAAEAGAAAVRLLPVHQLGEVLIGGASLAAGYLRDPAATAARFVSVPVGQLQGAFAAGGDGGWRRGARGGRVRLFRTGDLGFVDARGALHITGRLGLQVKLHGVRVDLSEVEATLAGHPAVRAAAARAWPLPRSAANDDAAAADDDAAVLAGYAELETAVDDGGGGGTGAACTVEDLQAWCRARLPPAAVPSEILLLPRLPRAPAGKVQRSALPPPTALPPLDAASAAGEPPSKRYRGRSSATPAAVSEADVAAAFGAALDAAEAPLEPTTSLFAAGGTSLTAALVAGRLGVAAEIVMQHPTVRSLAAHLRRGGAAAPAPPAPPAPAAARALGGAGALQLTWRAKLEQCVDAAPVHAPHGRVFACSHAGDVVCLEAGSGRALWRAGVAGRADAGVVACRPPAPTASAAEKAAGFDAGAGLERDEQLAVGSSEGLHFLAAATGRRLGAVEAGGGVRGAPAVDPWEGLVWAATRGGQVVVTAAPGVRVASFPCGAAASAPLAFSAARRLAFAACLDGRLLALQVGAFTPGDASLPAAPSLALTLAWDFACGAPLFSTPAPLPGRGPGVPAVAVAAVDGRVTALSGAGVPLWRCDLGAGVFAPLLSVRSVPQEGGGGAAADGDAPALGALLAGTEGGALRRIDAATGRLEAAATHLHARVTGLVTTRRALCASTADGRVAAFELGAAWPLGRPLDCVRLPGEVFALAAGRGEAGGAGGGGLLVGCRDEHVYCLRLG